MTDEPDKRNPDKADKDKPQPRRPGGKTKRIAITAALITRAINFVHSQPVGLSVSD
jgi:hypothetical protein